MRLNWSLKHATSFNGENEKPLSADSYMNRWGLDLYLPFLVQEYIQFSRLTLESDMTLRGKTLYDKLSKKLSRSADTTALERYNLWDGVTVSYLLDKKGVPVPRYRPHDRNLRIAYLKVTYVNGSPVQDCFELNITKERYTHICPLEYYNYTEDYPALD